jgi:voltage-gated potassium channel
MVRHLWVNPALKKLTTAIGLLLVVYSVGVAGYMLIEGWGFEDASFMTVITVATVGYGEVHQLDTAGRWFTVALILGGMGVILYGVSSLTAFIVEGELGDYLRRTKMEKQIGKLSGHYILCGAGRVGNSIMSELVKTGHGVVVVDQDLPHIQEWREKYPQIMIIHGDATNDAVLENAGVRRAAGLLASLREDKDNLFIVLSARALNTDLRIVARADEESSRDKLLRAGADSVVFPHLIGGMRMASQMVRPNVVNFLDTMLRERDGSLRVEEVRIVHDSPIAGKTVAEADLTERTGALLMALRDLEQRFEFNPHKDRRLEAGLVLMVMGDRVQLESLRKLATES